LAKMQPLTETELQVVWKHPLYSAEILRQANSVDDNVRSIIVQHMNDGMAVAIHMV